MRIPALASGGEESHRWRRKQRKSAPGAAGQPSLNLSDYIEEARCLEQQRDRIHAILLHAIDGGEDLVDIGAQVAAIGRSGKTRT